MQRVSLLVCIIGFLFCIKTYAQIKVDTLQGKEEQVVVTASRSERKLSRVTLPVQLISKQDIYKTGSLKLQDILQEQMGIALANVPLGTALNGYPNPFGQGIQMLGLDPAYNLILLDGEPLIGRNAGILKLGRITTGNIKQIEIVKGPSSCLYGSEALAGVINILTDIPQRENIWGQLHKASNGIWGSTISYENKFKNTRAQGFLNYYRGSGYDLDPNVYGKTVDPFRDISGQLKIIQNLSKKDKICISVRNYNEKINNNYIINWQGQSSIVKGPTEENDFTTFVQWQHISTEQAKWSFRTFYNRYQNKSLVNLEKTGERFDETTFDEYIIKPEIQFESSNNDNFKYVFGSGVNSEMINSSRYAGRRYLNTTYLFTQEEFYFAQNKWALIAGGRLDKRNDYNLRLSPRISIAYIPSSKWKFSASVGSGFKAPDFRHMYLSFFNSQIGYSLIGASDLYDQLKKLQQQGQIDTSVNLAGYSQGNNLLPETSVGAYINLKYNAKKWHGEIGFFRNDVNNLIDRFTLPFTKKNGGNIFSYHNISKIFTQGIEGSISTEMLYPFIVSLGYQFLSTGDKSIIQDIEQGKVFSRDPYTFETKQLTRSDYGGLFNRSRHSGNIKIAYEGPKGFGGFVRFIYRGRMGFADLNGNNIPDIDQEYVPAFWLCNISLQKNIKDKLQVQAGIENFLNYTNRSQLPQYPGRTFFININYNISKILSKSKS